MVEKMKRIVREPVSLFFILGSLLFLFYSAASNYYIKKNNEITISSTQLALLKDSFEKTWNRAVNETELQALIENHIKDEVFYREAVLMGLDKSDLAIKRRLRQIMELVLDDYSSVYPSESQLQKYLSEHPDKFRQDDRISFTHQYFSMDEKQEGVNRLSLLQKGASSDEKYINRLSLIPEQFENESLSEIVRSFGDFFSKQLFKLEKGTWQGPLESAYGWHLVLVSRRSEGIVPPLSEIWDQVEREWALEKKQEMKAQQFEKMRARYTISVEKGGDDY